MHPLSPRWSKTAAAVAVLALGACAPDQSVSSNPEVQDFPSAARNTVDYSSMTLSGEVSIKVGTSTKLSVRTSSRSRGSIKWQSSNPNAASVNSQGNVTGKAEGSTYVTASGFAVSETYLVNVTPAYTLTGFRVSPSTGTALAPGQTRQFSTQQLWSDGQTRDFGVTYTATGGSISSSGLFTAGSVAGSFMVIANCLCGALDTAFVTVELPQLTQLTVSPKTVSLNAGATQQFGATANWSTGATTLPPITWSTTGGSVSTSGLYTAPTTAGTYRVIVAHSGGTLRDTATVTVASSTPTLSSLSISPKNSSISTGATQQFSASALWSNGGTTLPAVSYSAIGGGVVTSTGLYTAPATPGTYRVAVSGGGKADTASIAVTSPTNSGTLPSVFGPGPNAPAWSGKTIYPQELFNTPIPVHYAGANAAGFKGWQGFDGMAGVTYKPTRVRYPTVSTPIGEKPVLEVTYPGASYVLSASNQTTYSWPTDQAYSIRVTGTWSGTLIFERSVDGVEWTPISLRGTRAGSGATSTSGSETSVNGVWASDDSRTLVGGKFRVRAANWVSGSATVAVGMQGGAAAARMSAGGFTGGPTRIYTRALMYVDPNWTNGANTGTKFFFFAQNQGNNHFIGAMGGRDDEKHSGLFMGLQQSSFRNFVGTAKVPVGTWWDLEFVFIANTPGSSNGVVRAWINGVEAINASDVMYFNATSVSAFTSMFMDPTYGGGEAPPPHNVFFRLAGWYRESAP